LGEIRDLNGLRRYGISDFTSYKREEAIIKLKIEQGISFGYARKLYMEKVESTKTTYSQMVLSMAEEEAARLANEIHSVREKTERTEAMKETLKKEINRLEDATKEILNLQRRKNVLEGIIASETNKQQEEYATSQQNTTQSQETSSSPISQLSYPTQIPTTSQTPDLSINISPLRTSCLIK
jgi:cysteinyl-tRNA synthetase